MIFPENHSKIFLWIIHGNVIYLDTLALIADSSDPKEASGCTFEIQGHVVPQFKALVYI